MAPENAVFVSAYRTALREFTQNILQPLVVAATALGSHTGVNKALGKA
jgi:hypothetical protein